MTGRDESGGRPTQHCLLSGLAVTGGVITSAGAVLAVTFLTLTSAPQVAFIEIGVLVAVGVLIDTFLVRPILVPALMLDVGRVFWWPGRMARGTNANRAGQWPEGQCARRPDVSGASR